MSFLLLPWQFLLIVWAGWINRDQQAAIEYLRAENRVLREMLGKKRVLLNEDQRRRLAVRGQFLGHRRLALKEFESRRPRLDGYGNGRENEEVNVWQFPFFPSHGSNETTFFRHPDL